MQLIDTTKAIESIDEIVCSMSVCINSDYYNGMRAMKDMALHAIEKQPTVDAVPVKVVEQFKWERDTAIQQLEEHGIPFCGKADVVAIVRCKDCKWWDKKDDAPYGYCMAMKHGFVSSHWEIGIYRTYKGDFYCADGERREE